VRSDIKTIKSFHEDWSIVIIDESNLLTRTEIQLMGLSSSRDPVHSMSGDDKTIKARSRGAQCLRKSHDWKCLQVWAIEECLNCFCSVAVACRGLGERCGRRREEWWREDCLNGPLGLFTSSFEAGARARISGDVDESVAPVLKVGVFLKETA